MSVTSKYELELVDYGTTGWNGILSSNTQDIDDYLHTYLRYPVVPSGSISTYDPLCVINGEFNPAVSGEAYKGNVVGIAIENGDSGETIRAQRAGPITNTGWTFSGSGEIYLDATGLTQTLTNHKIGISIAPTVVVVQL